MNNFCKNCNKLIDVNNVYGKGIFCNKKCQLQHAYESKKDLIAKIVSEKTSYDRREVEKFCLKCSTPFTVVRLYDKNGREHIQNKEKQFCSTKCSHSRIQTNEVNEKRKKTFLERNLYAKKLNKICPICKVTFETILSKQNFCSVKCATINNINKASLAYRNDEIQTKNKLELLLNTTFNKEYINGYYFDFCDIKYIIEYTNDKTRGMYEAITRLSSTTDSRIKILISHINSIGEKYQKICSNIILIDIKDFNKEDYNFSLNGVTR